jgi:RES domain-containing protein
VSDAVLAWRIAAQTRDRRANDLSGNGSARYPGRWNEAGQRVVYAASTIALAVLETAAHVNPLGLPLDRFVVRIEIPKAVYARREALEATAMDPGWGAIPAGRASVEAASPWYRRGGSAVLLAPSVIVPEEQVVLINATHPDAAKIKAVVQRPFHYASIFRRAS